MNKTQSEINKKVKAALNDCSPLVISLTISKRRRQTTLKGRLQLAVRWLAIAMFNAINKVIWLYAYLVEQPHPSNGIKAVRVVSDGPVFTVKDYFVQALRQYSDHSYFCYGEKVCDDNATFIFARADIDDGGETIWNIDATVGV